VPIAETTPATLALDPRVAEAPGDERYPKAKVSR
jgi:hypothetical protein